MKKSYLLLISFSALLLIACENNSNSVTPPESPPDCTDEQMGVEYPCENIGLLAHLGVDEFQGDSLRLNDIWGWTDPSTGKEYALVGLNDGVSFVDISSPTEPLIIGKLQETATAEQSKQRYYSAARKFHDDHEAKSAWRDFKVYEDHLFVVSDGQPHGLQVFDLTRLREVSDPPVTFTEDALYEEFGNAHNLAINTETGYAYATGSNTFGGGLHIINIQNPLAPSFAGFHSDSTVGLASTGYVHDTQCVTYQGPDEEYRNDELCFNSSETHLAIANVTDKDSTYTIAAEAYKNASYAHQGWLTEDQRYFLLDDELDEERAYNNTRTIIWDLQDLDNPKVIGTYEAATTSIDHNLYIKGKRVYQANYTSGLRILELDDVSDGKLREAGYFDTYPQGNEVAFNGAWSNFPYFSSGVIVVSDISNGLFILRPLL